MDLVADIDGTIADASHRLHLIAEKPKNWARFFDLPDYIVKADLLQEMRDHGLNPVMAFEDREQVVRMWRENNITCFQVAEGRY